ncbi:MAG: DUF927 domain-containing protein [Alphaproteobacteria bacterium]|nr:DUF927 domain-containing protein [Alphaproteobacteria bacterium]
MKRYIEVNQTGWIDATSYLCPSFSISDSKNNFIMQESHDVGYEISGVIEEWQKQVADLCQNNSLLTFSLCVALAPVLLRYFPEINTTIFHLVGRSSIGKTTALKVAASVWGNPKKYIKQWRATGNAQEGVAEKHNDSLLILDEIGQANDKDIQQTVYMIGNEKGKSRMTADAALRKTKSWRLLCLSSGEIGISEKIEAAGERVHSGVLVRCIDIEAQSAKGIGIFEDLRGSNNGNEFSTILAERTSKYYGTAARVFTEGIVKIDESTIRNTFHESLGRIKSTLELKNVKDGTTSRVLNSFALINTAGTLASSDYIGVLNHNSVAIDEDICNVLQRCLPNVYNQEDEETAIVEDVLQFLQQNESRFRRIHRNDPNQGFVYQDEGNRNVKWLGGFESKEESRIYYVFPNAFKDEICKWKSSKMYRKILQKRGVMLTYTDGKDRRYTINGDRIRMVTLCFDEQS